MFKTADGEKSFGSGFRAKKYDEFHSKPTEHKEESRTNAMGMSKKSQPAAENKEDEGMNHEDPKQVVAEHGPATTVHIRHDRVANKHHVTSTHDDGHVAESDHPDVVSAHEHGKQLAGAEGKEEDPDEFGSQADNSSGDMDSFGLGSQAV
jgi:hypothetical protein